MTQETKKQNERFASILSNTQDLKVKERAEKGQSKGLESIETLKELTLLLEKQMESIEKEKQESLDLIDNHYEKACKSESEQLVEIPKIEISKEGLDLLSEELGKELELEKVEMPKPLSKASLDLLSEELDELDISDPSDELKI